MVVERDDWCQAGEGEAAGLKRWGGGCAGVIEVGLLARARGGGAIACHHYPFLNAFLTCGHIDLVGQLVCCGPFVVRLDHRNPAMTRRNMGGLAEPEG